MRCTFFFLFVWLQCAVYSGIANAVDNPAPAIRSNKYQVQEQTLANGLKILVKEDHRAPVVTSQIWYRIGAADEYSGITGISHVLEHMMFKGTERFSDGAFSETLAKIGAQDNAFTSRDYTAYYQLLGSAELATSFELESDRMRNLLLLDAEFKKEIEVVKEERRLRVDDNPNALVYEQLYATAFDNSPYRNPVIGWMDDLENLTVQDVRTWYQQWYAPNNATLVVVGDVKAKEVFQLAQQYFGATGRQPLPARKPRLDRAQIGERRVTVATVATLPYVLIGYKVPVLRTAEDVAEAYALTIAAGVLDGGNSARLSKELIREQELAADAGASYDLHAAREDLFLLDATPAAGHTVEELEQALVAQIERLKAEPINAAELERVKTQVIAELIYQQDSVQRQAYLIGALETVGLGWSKIDELVDQLQRVTPQQVQAVAQKYFIASRRTVAQLQPTTHPAHVIGAASF